MCHSESAFVPKFEIIFVSSDSTASRYLRPLRKLVTKKCSNNILNNLWDNSKKKITGREITCPGSWVVIGVEPGLHSKFMRFAGGGTAFREVQTQPSPSRSFNTHSKKKKKTKQQASRNKVQAKGQLYCLH